MISTLRGTIIALSQDRAVVEIGGVGLSLSITPNTNSKLNIGNSVFFYTSLVVREDSLTLFGFLDEESRSLFELLQTVSGIGPKVALAILGALSPADLSTAIASEDIKVLEKVPGIGKKGAQRLILELKGRLGNFTGPSLLIQHQPLWREQVSTALISLGYSAKEADTAISTLMKDSTEKSIDLNTLEISSLLKLALQSGR